MNTNDTLLPVTLTEEQHDVLKGFVNKSYTSKLDIREVWRINSELHAMGLLENVVGLLHVTNEGLRTFGTPHALRILATRTS